jgi:hypothetical protein
VMAWWLCETIPKQRREIERTYRTNAEALIALGFCDEAQRKAIEEQRAIEWELDFWANDRTEYPDDYRNGELCKI